MVACAVVVDISRLSVYGATFFTRHFEYMADQGLAGLIVAGTLSAFLGAFIGRKLLDKVTLKSIQMAVAARCGFR